MEMRISAGLHRLGDHPLAALIEQEWSALTPPADGPSLDGYEPIPPNVMIDLPMFQITIDNTGAVSMLLDKVRHVSPNLYSRLL